MGELSREELREQLEGQADTTDVDLLHDEIREACNQVKIEKKNVIVRESPLLPSSSPTSHWKPHVKTRLSKPLRMHGCSARPPLQTGARTARNNSAAPAT